MQVDVRKVLNSSEQTQGRSSRINSSDKRRARPLLEGPQTSERVSRQEANHHTMMGTKAEAP